LGRRPGGLGELGLVLVAADDRVDAEGAGEQREDRQDADGADDGLVALPERGSSGASVGRADRLRWQRAASLTIVGVICSPVGRMIVPSKPQRKKLKNEP
jgi:hypothetical protein